MTKRFRRPMLVLGTTILVMQAVFMPVGIVYAETTNDTEEQEQVELPAMKNYLEDEQISDPRFFFTRSRMQGTAKEPLQVTFFSDQEVSEARVFLPEEATLLKDQLSAGISVKEGVQPNEWVVQSKHAQNTFVLPLIVEKAGNYEVSVEETTAQLEIIEEKDQNSDEELSASDDHDDEYIQIKEDTNSDNVSNDENVVEDDEPTLVGDSNEFLDAITSDSVSKIQLSTSITLTQLATIRSNKEINLNGNELILNGSAELRFSGNIIEKFILKNGKIIGNSTTFIGDGNNGNPTSTTNQLSSLNVYLEDINVQGNNFYNAMTTNVYLDGDIVINVRNTGFRVKNFTARIGSNVSIYSSGGTANGTTAQINNIMQGVTMGNYATNGTKKEFLVEKNAKVSIEVDAGGQYNNGIADFSDLNVYGSLSVDTWGTSLRSTTSYSLIPFVYVNFFPESKAYIRTRSSVRTGVFYTYPAILNVDSPEKFDMIYYGNNRFFWPWQGSNISGSGIRNSTISFKNMDIAVWENAAMGVGEPALLDSNLTFLEIKNLNYTNTGSVSTDSTIFSSFNPNNYSRISNDINMPSPNPSLPLKMNDVYQLPSNKTKIDGIARYVDQENTIIEDTIVTNADIIFSISGSEYETKTDENGEWELEIDISKFPSGTTGLLKITDESMRSRTVEIIIEDDVEIPVAPVDPLDPEIEVDPENKPELPEDQGPLSIDFISSFNFGSQTISVHDQTYYAQPQRLLNEDGTVNETEERPNYIQISDRRPENERDGWELAVTQKEQFKGEKNQVLNGASLNLSNQKVITVQGVTAPVLQSVNELLPGNRQTLLKAQSSEGTGTWIYRFGDRETAGESIILDVPRGTNPEATTYSTTLTWELSAVPDN